MRVSGFGSVLLTAVLFCSSVECPAAAEGEPALELTTDVVNQRYCVGDADLDGVRLRVKLQYRNVSNRPIILHKSSTTVHGVIVRMSPDGEIESNARLSVYSTGPWKLSEASLKKTFVILQPGERYETETVAGIFVTRKEATHIQGAVNAGDHYLQLMIGTWGGTPEVESVLRRKWQSYGLLWTDSITSKPMRFTIAKKRMLRDCQ